MDWTLLLKSWVHVVPSLVLLVIVLPRLNVCITKSFDASRHLPFHCSLLLLQTLLFSFRHLHLVGFLAEFVLFRILRMFALFRLLLMLTFVTLGQMRLLPALFLQVFPILVLLALFVFLFWLT